MLVVSGAVYYRKNVDQIVIPDQTTTKDMVTCHVFERFDKVKDDMCITYKGVKYHPSTWGMCKIDSSWLLLSDLSELEWKETKVNYEEEVS